MKTVVIIGAGPCGLLIAHYLLRRENQYCIELYDKRSDPRLMPISTERSHSISLGFRGRAALRQIGLESLAIERGVLASIQEIYNSRGVVKSMLRKQPRLIIERNVLTNLLLETLIESDDPSRLKIHFDWECIDIDTKAKLAFFQSASGYRRSQVYDLLIGADGIRSKVRNVLQHKTELEVRLDKGPLEIKNLTLRCPEKYPELNFKKNSVNAYCLGAFGTLVSFSKPDGTYSGLVGFTRGYNNLAQISSSSGILKFFRKHMGALSELISLEEADAFAQKPFFQTTTVICNRYHFSNSVLLMGDAAHAVSPLIGQGCSSSLEDSLLFDQLLDKFDDDLNQALPQFTQSRLPDMIALAQIADNLFSLNLYIGYLMLLKHIFDRTLHYWFPNFWTSSFVDMLAESTIPYSKILQSHSLWIKTISFLNQLILRKNSIT